MDPNVDGPGRFSVVSGLIEIEAKRDEIAVLVERLSVGDVRRDGARSEDPSELNAYLILGGEGWKLRQFYVSGGLAQYMPDSNLVEIMTLEAFVAHANRGML